MKIQFVSFLQNLIIFAFSNFGEISKSNTHKLLQGLNRLHFLKNRNSKWSWNEWLKKYCFSFKWNFNLYQIYLLKRYTWYLEHQQCCTIDEFKIKKNSVDNKDSNNIWKSYQRSRARFAMSSASSLINP